MSEEQILMKNIRLGKLLIIGGIAFCAISFLLSLDAYLPKQSLLFNLGKLKAFWGIPLRYCLISGIITSLAGVLIKSAGITANTDGLKQGCLKLYTEIITSKDSPSIKGKEGVINCIWLICFLGIACFSVFSNEDTDNAIFLLFPILSIPLAIVCSKYYSLYKVTWAILLSGMIIAHAIVFKSFLYGLGVVISHILMAMVIYAVFLLVTRKPRRWPDFLNQLIYLSTIFFALNVLNNKVIAPKVQERLNQRYSSSDNFSTGFSPQPVTIPSQHSNFNYSATSNSIPSVPNNNQAVSSTQPNSITEEAIKEHKRLIYKAHPDFEEMPPNQRIVFLKEMEKWANYQPDLNKRKELTRIYNNGTTEETIWLFTEFKKSDWYKRSLKDDYKQSSNTNIGESSVKENIVKGSNNSMGDELVSNNNSKNSTAMPIDESKLTDEELKIYRLASPEQWDEWVKNDLGMAPKKDYTKIYKTKEELDAEPFWNKLFKKNTNQK